LWAFLVFGDGVEEVGDLNLPRMMFHLHLRKGRDDSLAREVCLKDMFRAQEAPTTTLYIDLYVF
jgi:hypothetical protein